MSSSLRNAASVAPRNGKYITWMQSPNGRWVLAAGHWSSREAAEAWLHYCGYRIVTHASAIVEIERQMAERMDNPTITPGA